ncbi:MAG: ParA family protein [Magnetococcales bacterium]|nr:ParA family protein [Magnetococcales bacterium]
MKIFSVYNFKGGVGKTTNTVNLAYLSAMEGVRTVIWDLDPQGGTSFFLCVKPKIKGGAKAILKGKPDLDGYLRLTGYPNLDLLPADISYRHLDQYLHDKNDPVKAFARILKALARDYDHIFLDCPPGLSLVAENVFRVSHVLVVPLIPSTLSLRAYNKLVQFLSSRRTKKLRVAPFFNQVNLEKSIHRVVTQNVLEHHPIFLKTTIPDSNVIESMGIKRAPVFTYARTSSEAEAFRSLWREIKARKL